MWFLVVLGIAVGLFIHESKIKDLQEMLEKAASISKYFGKSDISLFYFSDKNKSNPVHVWALVDFDYKHNPASAVSLHEKHYVVSKLHSSSPSSIQKEEKKVFEFIKMLPYDIGILDAEIPFAEYEARVEMRRKTNLAQAEWRRKAKYLLNDNISKCETIISNLGPTVPDTSKKMLFSCLSDISSGVNAKNSLKNNVVQFEEIIKNLDSHVPEASMDMLLDCFSDISFGVDELCR